MAGAMSLAAVMMYFSVRTFLWTVNREKTGEGLRNKWYKIQIFEKTNKQYCALMQCVVFLWRRGESVKGDLLLKTTYVAYVFVYVRFVLQISLHLVKFVILDGLNDHI